MLALSESVCGALHHSRWLHHSAKEPVESERTGGLDASDFKRLHDNPPTFAMSTVELPTVGRLGGAAEGFGCASAGRLCALANLRRHKPVPVLSPGHVSSLVCSTVT